MPVRLIRPRSQTLTCVCSRTGCLSLSVAVVSRYDIVWFGRTWVLYNPSSVVSRKVVLQDVESMSATQQRDLAGRLALAEPARALSTARAIQDSWFACQALAWVARFAEESEFSKIIEESLRVTSAEVDPYRVVASAAWPIRAIVERNRLEMLAPLISSLLLRAQEIEILASRSEALFLLFQAVFPAGRKNWLTVLNSLRQASTPLISWRQKRNLSHAIMIVRGEDEQLAREMYDALDDQKLKRKIAKMLALSECCRPRTFFWTAKHNEA
jgi:hypothetical protein